MTVNYLVNISKNAEKLMTTQIRVDTYTTVKKLLKIAIKRFNISLNKNSGYLLFEQFILKPSKKSGKPNFDLPSNN